MANNIDWLMLHPVPTLRINKAGYIISANLAAETLCNMPLAVIIEQSLPKIIRLADQQLWRAFEDPEKNISAFSVILTPGRGSSTKADMRMSEAFSLQADITKDSAKPERLLSISPLSLIADPLQLRSNGTSQSARAAAAMLAHEIKNPLAGIKGAAQLLERQSSNTAKRFTNLIVTEADRIAHLIDRMQDLSQETAPVLRRQNLYPALFQARDSAVAGFAASIQIDEEYDPSLPDVMIDHDAIVQIILNLMKNAVQALHASPNPCIRISTAFRHGLSYTSVPGATPVPLPIEICISDNGPGVAPALVDEIFNPFVTGHTAGQGLGLALVDKLVRDTGGLVRHRRDEHAGLTHFEVHLPIAKGKSS
jgi:two-component system, NtrC family, nitrogen regulation sensor histidine kinase GlnL